MAHGILFVMFERRAQNVRAEVAVGSRKLHADGVGSLTLALDQYKYGDELIAQLFTRDPHKVLDRRADGWTRIQVFLGPADEETARALSAISEEILERVRRRNT